MSICFAYLGEFHSVKHRETVLSWMELFWSVGLIILPGKWILKWIVREIISIENFSGVAWLIIPNMMGPLQDLIFHSWNLFVAVASIPSLLIGWMLYYFPESPKFLIEAGEPDEALEVLRKIYCKNTGKNSIEYPVSVVP